MSVANLQAYALKKGIKKSWQEMSQAEQTTLRYQYIMDATKDSQGDFTKTQGTFANQLRIAKMGIQTLGASIGTLLLPILNKGIVLFNKMVNQINTGTGAFGKSVAFIKDNKDLIIAAIAGITAGFTAYGVVLAAQATATAIATAKQWLLNIAMDANPIGLIVTAIGALVAGIVWAYRKFDWFRKLVLGLWDLLKKLAVTIKDVFSKVGDATVTEKAFRAGTGPQHANGTSYFRGGSSLVNERGGEMQVLRNGTSIIPADRTKQMIEGSSQASTPQMSQVNLIVDGKVLGYSVVNWMIPELNLRLGNV